MLDTAETRYGEALALEPKNAPARLGLGSLMLRQDRTTDAEPFFRSVLADDLLNVEAMLGLAIVDIKKGGDHVNDGEAAAKRALERTPNSPKAHYVLGRAHESRGDAGKAAEEYRKAAELLMDR
jgi:Tfp pilus assembly protein PilF